MNRVDRPEFECMIGTSTAARCRRNETAMTTESNIQALVNAIRTNTDYIAKRIREGEAAGYEPDMTSHLIAVNSGRIHALKILGFEELEQILEEEFCKAIFNSHLTEHLRGSKAEPADAVEPSLNADPNCNRCGGTGECIDFFPGSAVSGSTYDCECIWGGR